MDYASKSKFVLQVIEPIGKEYGYKMAVYSIENGDEFATLYPADDKGSELKVCISCDSNKAILIDVLKALGAI